MNLIALVQLADSAMIRATGGMHLRDVPDRSIPDPLAEGPDRIE